MTDYPKALAALREALDLQAKVGKADTIARFAGHARVTKRARDLLASIDAQKPAAWRIFDGEGGYDFRDELPSENSRAWSARYGRKWEPLFAAPPAPAVPVLHPRTADLVLRFAVAVAEKLADAERKYGYADNWAMPDWMDECRAKLVEHVAKGDPRDVAAYAAFLWHHGDRTAPPAAPAPAVPDGDIFEAYKSWPEDIRKKLSAHDLRRMAGWAPRTRIGDWAIDTSAGRPILTYKACSVIESEDARYVLSLLRRDAVKQTAAATLDADQIERDFERVISQREEREAVINDILDLVLGTDRSEWSSAYDFRDAVIEVEERMAALTRQQPSTQPPAGLAVVPEGYALVPVEPTEEMLVAALDQALGDIPRGLADWMIRSVLLGHIQRQWAAMLAAANKENTNG